MLGAEINILNYKGTLGLDERYFKHLDIRIAGIHEMCYKYGTIAENTQAVINTIKNPVIDIISHPDDGNCPLDYDEVVQAAKEYHVLLEINNNSLRSSSRKNTFENSAKILELCRKQNIPVLISSDAHYMTDIANFDNVEKVLGSVDFPEELIINSSAGRFREFIAENREREKKINNQ